MWIRGREKFGSLHPGGGVGCSRLHSPVLSCQMRSFYTSNDGRVHAEYKTKNSKTPLRNRAMHFVMCKAWLTPKTRPPPCYHAEFGRSMWKGIGINRGNPKVGECWGSAPLGRGAYLTLTSPFTRAGHHAEFNRYGTTVEIRRKTGFLASRLSRSSEVTRIGRLSMPSY